MHVHEKVHEGSNIPIHCIVDSRLTLEESTIILFCHADPDLWSEIYMYMYNVDTGRYVCA